MNNWEQITLNDISTISSGKSVKYEKELNLTYPVLGSNGQIGTLNDYNFEKGYLLGRVGAAGSVQKITSKVWASDNTLTIKLYDGKTDFNFMEYLLKYLDYGKYATKTAQPLITQSILKQVKFSLPPLKEQQKIAEILSSVDAAIEKTEQVIAKTEEVKKGLMQQLLTKGIGHKEFKQTELGEIPVTWKVTPLIGIVNKTQLGTNDVANSEYGVPLIKMGNLTFGGFNFKKLEYINNPQIDYSNYSLHEGDFLFNTRNTPELVGKSAVWHKEREDAIYNNNILKIIFNDTINSDYICYQFNNGLCFSTIRGLATGTTSVAAIYWKDLSKIKLAIPDKQEQDKICSILKYHERKVQNEQKKIDELNKIKQGLMQQLLTGQVRVKID